MLTCLHHTILSEYKPSKKVPKCFSKVDKPYKTSNFAKILRKSDGVSGSFTSPWNLSKTVFYIKDRLYKYMRFDWKTPSVAQSDEQAPFTSEFVGSILATDSCEKSQSTLCRKSWVFSGCSGFLPQGKLTGWVYRINTVKKVITIVVKIISLG
jgi:hypothetical protein